MRNSSSPARRLLSVLMAARVLFPNFVVAELAPGDTTAPTINSTSPTANNYLLKQLVRAAYVCSDAGSGAATCAGTVADGAPIDTASVGTKTFAVNASDAAGNTTSKSVAYTVAYGVSPQFDQSKAHKSGSTIPIKLRLVDAAGNNVSAPGVVLTATAVTRVSDNAEGALSDPGNSNPDFNFRFDGGEYHFNLQTGGYATGTYLLSFKAGNSPTTYTIEFKVR